MSKKLTTEIFIEKAREVHGDKYDYSKVEYVNSYTKVIIICPEHGEFLQKPNNHLKGQGCPICGGKIKLTTESFIEKAKEIHGDKYDYSKVEYVNAFTKVIIICPEHGEWEQTPNSHLSGQGCPICAGNIKLTTEGFIEKAKKVHGDKYDYSKTVYVKAHTKVIIICPEHGEFLQTPNNHLNGSSCPICAGKIKLTTEIFIEKAREVHGDKYGYSKVEYVKSLSKVIIICPEHGEWEQQPNHHLSGKGCPICAKNQRAKKRSSTTEIFIEKAREVHGDKYDYSKVDYVNNATKITIICPEHGEFLQIPASHLSDKGCLKCSGQGFEYATFDEVKEIIKPLGIKTQKEYFNWWGENEKYCREKGIPKQPDAYYQKHQ